jgi:hypothetical protein
MEALVIMPFFDTEWTLLGKAKPAITTKLVVIAGFAFE